MGEVFMLFRTEKRTLERILSRVSEIVKPEKPLPEWERFYCPRNLLHGFRG